MSSQSGKEYNKKIQNIIQMGFTTEQAQNALKINDFNFEKALDYLLNMYSFHILKCTSANPIENAK